MDTELRKLKKFTKMMRKEGILSLKTSEVEIHLAPLAVFKDETPKSQDLVNEETGPQYTEEETLFWSSPGIAEEAPKS